MTSEKFCEDLFFISELEWRKNPTLKEGYTLYEKSKVVGSQIDPSLDNPESEIAVLNSVKSGITNPAPKLTEYLNCDWAGENNKTNKTGKIK